MIEITGVIEYCAAGHTHVDVVVRTGAAGRQVTHKVGLDEKPNRGRIITFLGNVYQVEPSQIVWPAHIELE